MAGSRAASAREPGQIREEAALSDTARAPRASLAGAEEEAAAPDALAVRPDCLGRLVSGNRLSECHAEETISR